MTTGSRDRSNTVRRTRRAILDAAASIIASKNSATIAEIAEAAGMARSTVHRHFPERADLVAALGEYADQELFAAGEHARLNEGAGAEAILRLCEHYFERADLVMAAYQHLTTADQLAGVDQVDPRLVSLIERGHADGSIDPKLTSVWAQQFLWSMLYSAWITAKANHVSNFEALDFFLCSFAKVLRP